MQLELGQLQLRHAALRIHEPRQQEKLLASLAAQGQQMPVTVIAAPEQADEYVLIDGYARVGALRELARDVVEAVVLDLGEPEALIRSHRLDGQRARSALEDGWLLEELTQHHGLGLEALARRLGRSRSWVSRRLALVLVLPSSVQDRVREGQLSAQVATKYLVPLARANAEQCEQLVAHLEGYRPSVREMKRLYLAWRRGDAEQRARIVERPRLFLEASRADDDVDDPVRLLVSDLRGLGALSQRSARRIDEGVWKLAAAGEQRRIARAWATARRSFTSLQEIAEPWEAADARAGSTSRDPSTSS